MLSRKKYLKSYRVLFYFIFILAINVSCLSDNKTSKEYNYYERDYFGDFVLKKLEIDQIEGYNLLRYIAEYSNDELIEVRGYYYTGQLKFTDKIKDNRITETTYYYINGEKLLNKKYYYSNGKLKKIKQLSYDRQMDPINLEENFSYIKNNKGEEEIHFDSKVNFYRLKKTKKVTIIGNGVYNSEKKPVYIKTISPSFTPEIVKGENINEEIYLYNEHGKLKEYRSTLYNELVAKKRDYYAPILEASFNEDDKIICKNIDNFYNDQGDLIKTIIDDKITNYYKEYRFEGDRKLVYVKPKDSEELRLSDEDQEQFIENNLKVVKSERYSKRYKKEPLLIKTIKIEFQDETIFIERVENKDDSLSGLLRFDHFNNREPSFFPRKFFKYYYSTNRNGEIVYKELQ